MPEHQTTAFDHCPSPDCVGCDGSGGGDCEAVRRPLGTPRGIYVASRASVPERGAMWRALRADGVPISATWIDEDGEGATGDFGELWDRIRREVTGSVALILYAEPGDFPLKGAYVEVGMALAVGLPIYAILPGVALEQRSMRPVGSWLLHPLVEVMESVEAAVKKVLAQARYADLGFDQDEYDAVEG